MGKMKKTFYVGMNEREKSEKKILVVKPIVMHQMFWFLACKGYESSKLPSDDRACKLISVNNRAHQARLRLMLEQKCRRSKSNVPVMPGRG